MLSIKESQTADEQGQWIGPAPWIEITPPGPQARAAIERDNRVAAQCYNRQHPLVVRRAHGSVVEDVDGNRYLDFAAGTAVCSTGHAHARIVAAVRRQAGELIHICGSTVRYEPMIALSERLAAVAPGSAPKRVFLTNSGTEAIEAAIKLARWHTRRPWIIAFQGAFHGRTLGALSLSSSQYRPREEFGPMLPMVAHAPFGDLDATRAELETQCVAPTEVAAVVVQPVLTDAQFTVPPDDFLPGLRAFCDEHGILLVVDELESGMGRTGGMFGCEHFGVVPDILAVSKGTAGGLPLGAIIALDEVMTWPQGAHGSTYGGNPVACAAALETLKMLKGGLMAHGAEVGRHLVERLEAMTERRRCLSDVRGLGLLVAVDVVNRKSGRPSPHLRDRLLSESFRRGLILLKAGEAAIRFTPPLLINKVQLDVGLDVLDEVIATVTD